MTVPTDFQDFTDWYSARYQRKHGRAPSPATLRTKRVYLSMACKLMDVAEPRILGELISDRARLDTLLDRVFARHAPATARQLFHALKPFGEDAVAMGWASHSELRPEDAPSGGQSKPIVVYSPEEMADFVALARGRSLRWWAFIAFLAETGRRVGEALALEWAWFHLGADVPHVALPSTKNGDQQYVPLTRYLVEEVFTPENVETLKGKSSAPGSGFARSTQVHPFPWRYATAHRAFKKFCALTGLPDRGFHNFRHTVITQRLAQGVPLQAVATLAGHRTPAVTMKRYAHATALDYAKYLT